MKYWKVQWENFPKMHKGSQEIYVVTYVWYLMCPLKVGAATGRSKDGQSLWGRTEIPKCMPNPNEGGSHSGWMPTHPVNMQFIVNDKKNKKTKIHDVCSFGKTF